MKRIATSNIEPSGRSKVAATSDFHESWCVHPARQEPGRAAVGVVWIVAVALVLYATTFNIFWPVFAIIFLLGVLGRFFFPSRFTLDDDGICCASLLRNRRISWAEVRRFVYDRQGGLLSDRAEPSRLDAYRGVHVMFGDRAEIAEAIRARLPRDCRVRSVNVDPPSTACEAGSGDLPCGGDE